MRILQSSRKQLITLIAFTAIAYAPQLLAHPCSIGKAEWISGQCEFPAELLFIAEHQHRRFEDLPPDQQEEIRQRREKFKSLPPEERERIRRAKERFQNLSPEQREQLREKWRKMTPEQREKFKKEKKHEKDKNYYKQYRSDWS